jgi:hypothetical protein
MKCWKWDEKMEEINKRANTGIVAIIMAILGLIMILMTTLWFAYILPTSWLGIALDFLWVFISLALGVSSMIFGRRARKHGDSYGKYGMILGCLVIILAVGAILVTIRYTYPIISV